MTERITFDDVVDIASMAALNDYRTVGEKEAELWLMIAERERWTRATAMRVVLDYVSHDAGRPRLTPAAISDELRKARKQAAAAFVPPRWPDTITTDGQYLAWYQAQLTAFIDRALDEWAAGAPLPLEAAEQSPLLLEAGAAPPALREEIARHLPRIGSGPRRPDATPTRSAALNLDPRRRVEAHRELDAVRPAPGDATPDREGRATA